MVFPNRNQKKVCVRVLFHILSESFTVAFTLDLKKNFLNPILLLKGSFCSFLTINTMIFLPLKSQWSYLQGRDRDSDTENRLTDTGKLRGWDKRKKQGRSTHSTTCVTGSSRESAVPHRQLAWCIHDGPDGRRGGREAPEREDGACPWLMHADVQQRITSHCRAISHQLKIYFKKKSMNSYWMSTMNTQHHIAPLLSLGWMHHYSTNKSQSCWI